MFPSGTGQPTITSLNQNIGITQFYKADYHPTNPNIIIAGAQDNASPLCQGTLTTWGNSPSGGDGGGCAINQTNPNDQYSTSQDLTVFHTTDGWNTQITDISPSDPNGQGNAPFVGVLTLDPTHPNLLYTGTQYLFQYNATTGNWTYRLGNQALSSSSSGYLQAIAVAPTNGSVIYTGSVDGNVWVSTNQGAKWTEIDGVTGGAHPLPVKAITSISISPTNANDILVGLSGTGGGHLYRCADTTQGANSVWTDLSGSGTSALPDVPLNAVTRDPDVPASTYYVATDIGVFATTDGGSTWTNATVPLGLPNVQVNDLKAVPGTHYLNAATYGRGIWRISLQSSAPTVSSFTPTSGPVGTVVTVTGTNLNGVTAVRFHNANAATFSANGAGTQLTVTVPTGAGTGTFTVTTPGGSVKTTGTFTVTVPPTVTSFTPASGPIGTVVTVTGTNLNGVTAVRFHNANAATFSANGAGTQLTVTVPTGAGTGTFTVTTPSGSVKTTGTFTVVPPPTITSFTPTSGPVGTVVTVTGTNLSGVTAVRFHNANATTFSANGAGTQLTVTVPTGAGTGTFTVTTPGGSVKTTGTFTVS